MKSNRHPSSRKSAQAANTTSPYLARSQRGATGYRLETLRAALKPFRLHFFPTLRSTNDHAALMRRRGELYAPSVVLTTRQTAGRGRGGNSWFSSTGSITVTFVLPVNTTLAPSHLPLAAGLAVRNAVAEITQNQNIQLKWPNDLVVPQEQARRGNVRKLAGLLCERLDKIDLIGIGLNVNIPQAHIPPNLRQRIVYLQELSPRQDTRSKQNTLAAPFDLGNILDILSRHLHLTLVRRSETPFPALLREYDQHHALIGRSVTVISEHEPPIRGQCQGLDNTGRLILRQGRKLHRVIAGHVEMVE